MVTGEIVEGTDSEAQGLTSLPPEPVYEFLSEDTIPAYRSIEEAEDALYDMMAKGEALRIQQVQVLARIRDQRLYEQKLNGATNKPYTSMESYLKDLCKSTASFASDAPRTLKSWMTRWEIYNQQLGIDADVLLEMGAHFEILLPVAARERTTMELTEGNVPQLSGGMKLGKSGFEQLTHEIMEKVREARNNPGVDEVAWGVKDTRERVREILGQDNHAVTISFGAAMLPGDKIKMTDVTFWHQKIPYKVGDTIPLEVFKKIVGNATVEGLGDNWKD